MKNFKVKKIHILLCLTSIALLSFNWIFAAIFNTEYALIYLAATSFFVFYFGAKMTENFKYGNKFLHIIFIGLVTVYSIFSIFVYYLGGSDIVKNMALFIFPFCIIMLAYPLFFLISDMYEKNNSNNENK